MRLAEQRDEPLEAASTTGYHLDGMHPSHVEMATTESDVSEVLKRCHFSVSSVVPWGGGTRMGIGNTPMGYDVALDLTSLASEIDHVAGDMTVVCDAGVKISDLSSLLAESHQRLPFEVPHAVEATIGGSVASNAPSRLAPKFGGIRDWVIGMWVVLADGTLTKTGGRVVKNVQGYDLHRLHTGAFGTLGVIVRVALKLVPVVEGTRTVAMWFDRLGSASNAALDVGQSNMAIEAARLFSGSRAVGAIRELAAQRHMDMDATWSDPEYLMLVQVSGSNAALVRQVNELTGLAGTVPATGYEVLSGANEADIWTYAGETGDSAAVSLRIAAKSTTSLDLIGRLERLLGRSNSLSTSSIFDVGYGSLQFNVEEIDDHSAGKFVGEAKQTIRDASGSVTIERCPAAVKKSIDVFGVEASSARIMERMKEQFDPNRILNPGRFAFKI